jgi:acetylornithine deacetylase
VPNLHGNHKRYLYGPGSILVAHGDNEHVSKSDLVDAVAGYKKLVKEALNPTKRPPAIYRASPAQDSEAKGDL